jgi:hypothetical protein
MPKFADDPDGLGIIDGFAVDFGVGFIEAEFVAFGVGFIEAEFVAFGVGFIEAEFVAFGDGEAIFSPSFTVIFIFCPGLRLSMPIFASPCEVEGLITGFTDD